MPAQRLLNVLNASILRYPIKVEYHDALQTLEKGTPTNVHGR